MGSQNSRNSNVESSVFHHKYTYFMFKTGCFLNSNGLSEQDLTVVRVVKYILGTYIHPIYMIYLGSWPLTAHDGCSLLRVITSNLKPGPGLNMLNEQ